MADSPIHESRVTSWAGLLEELYRESWDPDLRRHRSPFVYRGMPNAANDLKTSLMRLAGGTKVSKLEGHLLRNFRMYARSDAAACNCACNWLSLSAHSCLPTRHLGRTF